ncbi:MAG: hypothetical protein KJZ80_09725 [Hyphomicrobiaceae bacterium]|nr:hypothetical protein [Hyphomicrobiaceae bacterium]
MADAISAIVGMALMVAFLSAIAVKLAETPLWIVSILGIVLMAIAFWQDAFVPLFRRHRGNGR